MLLLLKERRKMARGEIIEDPRLRNKTSVFEDRYHAGNLLAEIIKEYIRTLRVL